jgi:hypothetical protein
MKRDQLPRRRRNATYVIPQWKLAFVSTPKAACTTTKWMLADALGVDPTVFYRSLSGETSRSTTIHQQRWKWPDTVPRLRDLDDAQLAEITRENGWFLFTMTRHPSVRLWSAWQSKLLLREPRFQVQFAGEPWLPELPSSTEGIIDDWFRFVDAVAADPGADIMKDIHFTPQARLLGIGKTPYDRVYDTSEFGVMVADLHEQMSRNGFTGTLQTRRNNETPLPALETAFPQNVVDRLQKLFATDWKPLGYDDPMPPKLRPGTYSEDLVAAAAIVAERGDRIGDLARRARRLDKLVTAAGLRDVPSRPRMVGRLTRSRGRRR